MNSGRRAAGRRAGPAGAAGGHEWVPIEATAADGAGRIYRKRSYGPLLDVFVLDMRTYKDPNTADTETVRDGGILGRRQLAWLKTELARSRATWKVIANDLPLGLVVPDGPLIEAVAQGNNGAPLGRELEIGDLSTFIERRRTRNTVWLTADGVLARALVRRARAEGPRAGRWSWSIPARIGS